MPINDLKLSGQTQNPDIVRENFNKIKKFLESFTGGGAAFSNVLEMQSETFDLAGVDFDTTIRIMTVFMKSNAGACAINLPPAKIFSASATNENNTLWIIKGLGGTNSKYLIINSGSGGTIEGSIFKLIANSQTIIFQSNGEEYKILFDSAVSGGQLNSDWDVTSGVEEILNKPTIVNPVNADWNATTGLAEILNKPDISGLPYKLYIAILTATTADENPSVHVVYNTIGLINITWGDLGQYAIESDSLFPTGRTTGIINGAKPGLISSEVLQKLEYFGISRFTLWNYDASLALINGFGRVDIEIKVMNESYVEPPADDAWLIKVAVTDEDLTARILFSNAESLVIDWGDVSEDTVSGSDSEITHTYGSAGTYYIKLSGNMVANEGQIRFYTLGLKMKSIEYIGLIPGIVGFNSTFSQTAITNIPAGIFNSYTEIATFQEVFSYCSGLTEIPEGLFDTNQNVTNFHSAFKYCSLTGAAPELWLREGVTEFNLCFAGDTGLSNYDDIPDDWK